MKALMIFIYAAIFTVNSVEFQKDLPITMSIELVILMLLSAYGIISELDTFIGSKK